MKGLMFALGFFLSIAIGIYFVKDDIKQIIANGKTYNSDIQAYSNKDLLP